MGKSVSFRRPPHLRALTERFLPLNKKGLLARKRFGAWADALESGAYAQHRGICMAFEDPTPEDLSTSVKLLKRTSLGVLCEISGLAKFVPSENSAVWPLVQKAVQIEGLRTEGFTSVPGYSFETSGSFPAAGVRAWLIASNRLDDYVEDEKLQKEIISVLCLLMKAEEYYDFPEIAESLRQAVAPVVL